MSLNFTVQKVKGFQGIEDGQYTAQVDHIEYIKSDFGNHHIVNWKILSPSAFEGRIHQERYSVEHDNETVREIAINNFSKFCMEIGGLKEGDDPKEEDFLYKVATIYIRNRVGKKDGKSYPNVVKMELVGKEKPEKKLVGLSEAGLTLPSSLTGGLAAAPKEFMNDEVPF